MFSPSDESFKGGSSGSRVSQCPSSKGQRSEVSVWVWLVSQTSSALTMCSMSSSLATGDAWVAVPGSAAAAWLASSLLCGALRAS